MPRALDRGLGNAMSSNLNTLFPSMQANKKTASNLLQHVIQLS